MAPLMPSLGHVMGERTVANGGEPSSLAALYLIALGQTVT